MQLLKMSFLLSSSVDLGSLCYKKLWYLANIPQGNRSMLFLISYASFTFIILLERHKFWTTYS